MVFSTGWGFVAAMLVLASTASAKEPQPPEPLPGENGMDTSYGTIKMPYHAVSRDAPAAIEAHVRLHPGSGAQNSPMVLFAFVVATSTVSTELVELTTGNGTPLRIERDERDPGGRDQKLWVKGIDLPPPGEEIVLRGRAAADNNGRYQVGALVIAFDAEWKKVITTQGEVAQLYSYLFLTSSGVETSAFAPPFEGQGNVVPLWGLAMVAVMAGTGAYGWRRWRRRKASSGGGPKLEHADLDVAGRD